MARSHSGLTISQRKYTLDLISDFGLLAAKPVLTPIIKTTRLAHDDSPPSNVARYRNLVGRSLYLTNTRLYISFAVQQLNQFRSNPTELHYKACIRVLKYMKGSPRQGIFYPSNSIL